MRTSRIAILTHAGAMILVSAAATARSDPPTSNVVVETGTLRGVESDGVLAFKGIPFAAPPVGPLRWRAPQSAARWSGMRDASDYGHDCMQKPAPSDAAPLGTSPAEDCLYANVWRPAGTRAGLPVMVWIYGGGFVNGGASPPTYSGAELARRGILVFSFNYRLGRFGTFAHPLLTKSDPDSGLFANYGYMDQIAALRWVQRNIAAFGGDPANVTLVGESAGGMSVHTLMTSPLTQGLFVRAVSQSGGPFSLGPTTMAAAEETGIAFARSKGIGDTDPGALERLRALSAEQVTDGLSMASLSSPPPGPATFSSPIFDGKIAVDPTPAYRTGDFRKVPMMLGATSDDLGGGDGFMIAGARSTARLLAPQVPTFYYRFGYVAGTDGRRSSGAGHATDVPFFFDTVQARYTGATTPTDRGVGRIASGYLVNFVRSGDPNGANLTPWPRYDGGGAGMLEFTRSGRSAVVKDDGADAHRP